MLTEGLHEVTSGFLETKFLEHSSLVALRDALISHLSCFLFASSHVAHMGISCSSTGSGGT